MSRVPESHLLPDAVVAFVDGELSLAAHERAAAHLANCTVCGAEVAAQRQARTAVRGAQEPSMSDGFLASLRSIPDDTDLSTVSGTPDNLAVTDDGQLLAVQRPDKLDTHDSSVTPLGQSAALRRRTAQGAGVVVSGVVLSAIALAVTGGPGTQATTGSSSTTPTPDVLRAQFTVSSSSAAGPTSDRAAPRPSTSSARVPSQRAPAGMQR